MDTLTPSLKRLSFSLTLALSAVVALTANLSSAQSGAPAVSAVFPAPNSVSVDPAALISVTFSQQIDPTSITSRTLRVHGSMSGQLSGTLSYDAASRTATFDPAQDFKPGELIAVGLTSATHSITGTINLAAPYGWNFVAQAPYGSARFIKSAGYDVNDSPHTVYGADLDGDGDVDLATGSWSYNTVSILLNDGRGAFSAASPRDYVVADDPTSVRGADLDGDGDVDLVTTNGSDNTISVLLNAGNGHFTQAVPRDYAAGNSPYSVCLSDLDGDGDADAAITNILDDSLTILSNDGNGTFTPFSPHNFAVGNGPYDISCADLDDDGDTDLVTANIYSDNISVLLNNGAGSFTSAVPRDYATGGYPRSVCSADWDGDGDVDLATANYDANSVSILSNNGTGYFTSIAPGDLSVHNNPNSIQSADLDGDGDVDLVTANWNTGDISVLLNNGSGVFAPATPRDYVVGTWSTSVYAADLDGDADMDLVTTDQFNDQVSILLNFGLQIKKTALTPTSWPGQPVTYTLSYTNYDNRTMQGVVISDHVPISLTNVHYRYNGPSITPTGGLTYAWQLAPLQPGARGVITISAIVSPNLYARNGNTIDNHAIIAQDGHSLTDNAILLLDVGLEINKTALTPTSWPGQPVTYTIHYTNHNLDVMRGVVITDHIPISLTNVHYDHNSPVITPTDGLTYAWQVAPLPPGATGLITISAIVSPAMSTDEYLDNHAVIAHHGQRLTDTATLLVDVTPKLWLDASAAPLPSVEPGQRFTYTIQTKVSGVLTTSGWLTAALPAGTRLITATPGYAPASPVAGETITWPLPSGVHYPPTTLQYILVLTSDGPSRLLSYPVRAVYPGVIAASDIAKILLWNGVPTDSCQRDIALVFDRSGSMQELTRCYGCWDPTTATAYPLPFTNHCDPSEPLTFQGYKYISIEAEHYSSYETAADYHWDQTEFPKTWWAMQREPNRNSSGPDARGAWMMVGPHSDGAMHYPTIGDIIYPPNILSTPRLDYDFSVPTSGSYYVWIRAQGGSSGWDDALVRRSIHVGLNGTAMGTGYTDQYGPYNDGASSSLWRWTRVSRLDNLQADQSYTLNFWAAGPGFRLDKIVLTNDPRTNLMDNGLPLDWDYPGISDAGPVETHGRTGWACLGPGSPSPDPRFVPVDPVSGQRDDLYDEYQPISLAKDAAQGFARRLNHDLDQISYVTYSSSATIEEELYCIEHYGSCSDFEPVVDVIGSTAPGGSTNIAQALWYGILTLTSGDEPTPTGQGLPPASPGRTHYGRSETYGALILITDGMANMYPTLPSGYGNCYSDNLWPDQPGESTSQRRARECTVWFARLARDQGVALHTISLGTNTDSDLLAHIADLTGGVHYIVQQPAELENILEYIEADTRAGCFFSGVDVAKHVTPWPNVTAGGRLTYTIETTLSGWIRTPTLWLYDHAPSQATLITATPGYASGTALTHLAWPLPTGVFTPPLTLTHTIVMSAPHETGVLTNQAWVADDYLAPSLTFASASVTVSVRPEPTYALNKLVQPSTVVTAGQRVTYTLVVTTNRPDLPVVLSDTLPPGTAFVAASGYHTPAAPGPGDTLTWPLTASDFVNDLATRTLALTVTDAPAGGVLTNRAYLAGVSASVDLVILAQPTYQLRKLVEPASPITAGQRVTYTLVVTTNRPDLPVVLSDTLPPGTAFVAASGEYTPAAPGPGDTLTWPLTVGDFGAGVAQRTLTLDVTQVPDHNLLTNTAAVADAGDSVVLTVLPELVPLPDLRISHVSHQPAQPAPAQAIHFLVTVHNQGDADVPGRVAVELYAKDAGSGPPTGPADHAGGWCADPPACDLTRPTYVALFYGLASGQSITMSYSIALGQAGGYQVYAQVDVNSVGGATDAYGAFLESDEGNNVFDYGLLSVSGLPSYKLYLSLVSK